MTGAVQGRLKSRRLSQINNIFDAGRGKSEIGRILQLKSEIRNFEMDADRKRLPVRFEVSDFGFEMQDSSNFKLSSSCVKYVNALLRRGLYQSILDTSGHRPRLQRINRRGRRAVLFHRRLQMEDTCAD